ncbi:MAG: alpha-galactosidase [Anaerolineae bacterium]|nr:alpha-galactosidase [Anaerolineae bacterium]
MTENDPIDIKIAYIGGGSRYWARMVMTDLALCPHLTGEIALYDIDHEAALRNVERAKEIYGHPDARTTFEVNAYETSEEALADADFVFLSILPGPMWMFANDIDIPAKYGVLQTVGDTTGPGGISRALRTVPIYVDYAHQIMEQCPEAWVINYTNPMTLCTAALYAVEPDIKAFGCCHEVFGTQEMLAGLVNAHLDVPRPKRHDIKTDIAGVNHFTFATRAMWNGLDLFPILEEHIEQDGFWTDRTSWSLMAKERGLWFSSQKLVAFDFLRRFGALGAAGDRHLAEFVPWYLVSEENLHRYGVILTPSSFRLGTWQPPQNAPSVVAQARRDETGLRHSGEEGVAQMLALLGVEPLDTNVNLPNVGQLPDLPLGAVVETNAQFRKDSLAPVVPKPLPFGVEILVRRIIDVQALTLEAALMQDKDLAFQAVLNDPLCRISVDQAWDMFNELLEANAKMLPGWD